MKELLKHLRAHLSTRDPWILVYDNQGTFDSRVGKCIIADSGMIGHGSFFGVPVRRSITFADAINLNPRFQMRVARENLKTLIFRIEYLEGGDRNVA